MNRIASFFFTLFLCLQLFFLPNSAKAVTAYPYPIEFTQPDGSKITILLKGDEKVRWAETMDGYSIVHNKQGAYEYAKLDENNNMIPSGFIVRNTNQRSVEDNLFLESIPKALHYSVSQINQMQSIWANENTTLQNSFPTTGNRKLLVILANFSNTTTTYPSSNFDNYMNQLNYNGTGSFKDYYLEVSYGQLTVVTTVTAWVTLPNTHNYYGPDTLWGQFALDAVTAANNQTAVNFADYDNDGDGVVDGVAIFHQGQGQEETGSTLDVWSHSWDLTSAGFTAAQRTFDGVLVNSYTTMPERNSTGMGTIGVMCHEFGHNLGAPDFYDIDYATGGQYDGTGKWDLMANGSWNGTSGNKPAHPNGYIKTMIYNWASPTTITSASQITLNNAAEYTNSFYRYNTTTANEYFFIENRQQLKFDSYIPGHGMIIYHVDGSYISTASGINAGSHQGLYPVCANATGNPPTTYGTINSGGCPFPGTGSKTSFTDATTPKSMSWTAANTAKPITGITENITNKTVSFAFMGGISCTTPTTQATTFISSAIADNSMTIGWTRGTGNSVLVIARQASAVNENPVNGTAYTANAVFGSGTQIGTGNYVVYNGTGSSVNLTSLTSGTTCYYAIYEYNSTGNCYKNPALTGNATTIGYCSANSNSCDEHISNVTIGTINNNTTCSTGGYADYSVLSTNISIDSSLLISVTNGSLQYPTDQCGIWVDWNNNDDFTDDPSIIAAGSPGIGPYTAQIICPAAVSLGQKRMRIRIHYTNETTSPCGSAAWGEVEDYTINVSSTCIPLVITTQPVASQTTCTSSGSVSYTVEANTGTAPITYQWQFNNAGSWTNVSNGTPSGAIYTNGATNTLGINGITTAATYQYRCYLTNCSGANTAISNTASLVVSATPIVNNISSQTICSEGSTTIITPISTPAGASFAWSAVATTGISGYTTSGSASIPVQTITTIAIVPGTVTYTIVPSLNSCVGSSNTFVVNVNPKPIINTIASQTICSGGSTTLVTPISTPTGASFVWSAVATTGISGFTANGIASIPVQTLNTTAINSGTTTYTIIPTLNSCVGSSNTFVVNVNPKPIISNQTTTVMSGNAFTVIPIGVPSGTTYTWTTPSYTGGVTGGSAQLTGITNISQTLTILAGTGTATYVVTPVFGSCIGTTFLLTVTVNELCSPIVISSQPVSSQTACTSSNTTSFSVSAIGTNPITYQWQYNNGGNWESVTNAVPTGATYINGTTSTMSVSGIANAATSQYRCYLTNCSGANNATSNIALLIISALPSSAGAILGTTSVIQGQSNVSYSVPAIANAVSYEWVLPSGATGTSSTNNIIVDFGTSAVSGNITVKGINSCGAGALAYLPIAVNAMHGTLRLKVTTSVVSYTDEIIVSYGNASDQSGAEKILSLYPTAPNLYSTKLNKKWSINYLTTIFQHPIVSVGFKAGMNGNYTITASDFSSFSPTAYIYLKDLTNNIITCLNYNSTYSFEATTTDSAKRFQLIFSPFPYRWLGNTSNNWATLSNWDNNSLPTISDDIFINSWVLNQPHVTLPSTNPAICNNLTIGIGSSLTIDAGKALTVNGVLTNNSGDTGLILKSNASGTASLITSSDNVSARVERYIPHLNPEEFHMLSSPVASQAISPNFNGLDNFYVWNELTGEWIEYADTTNFVTVNGGTNFIPAKGYAVSYQNAVTKSFLGILNQGIISIPLTVTAGSYSGWNYIANPYPSSINWDAVSGWTRNVLDNAGNGNNAMWIWNPIAGQYGPYISNGGSSIFTLGVSNNIASSQGFWVKAATAGTLTMNNNVRVHSSQVFLKSTATSDDLIRFEVKGAANNYRDEIIIKFGNPSDQGGAEKMFSIDASAPSLYSIKFNKKWSINYLTTITQYSVVPVGFKAGVDAVYTIHASDLNSFFNNTYVYLKDLSTNNITDLHQNTDYSFTATTTDNENRFQLLFSSSPLGILNNASENTSIYSYNSAIYVNSNEDIKQIAIYNTMGQLIQLVENTKGKLSFNMNGNTFYLVRVITNRNVFFEKVFIK
ncbi:MAG: M6 family metalloprotease domain-containing protein [Bacteroidetes bacterium]|nr:M6 family metalloprotease domain-containing protein [Bacteroidota bacterium]